MKKKVLFLLLLCVQSIYGFAELSVTLNVTAGSLSSMIASSKKYEITHLTIVGNINGSDIKYLREMMGIKEQYGTTDGKLRYLDISEANIVAGGSYYGYADNSSEKYYTENNIVTPYMFSKCSRLDTLLLPNSVTKIEANTFETSSLRSITLPEQLEFFECSIPSSYLSEILLSRNNQHFKIIDGTLYSFDMKTLYRCPVSYADSIFEILEGVENIELEAFHNCSRIRKFKTSSTLKTWSRSLYGMHLDQFILNPHITYERLGKYLTIDKLILLDGYTSFDPRILGQYYRDDHIMVNNLITYCKTPPNLKIKGIQYNFSQEILEGNLYVPKGTYSQYYIAYGWGDFVHIYEMNSNVVPGDLNGDGEIGIADVTALVALVMSQESNENSDVNGDGETGVADVTALVNILMNQ